MFSTSGVLTTTTWREGKRIKLDQLFIRSNAGNLRIDTLSPVGEPLSTLVYDGGRLLIYDQANNIFYIGSATQDVIQTFLLVDIEPNALSTLLGGCMPYTAGTPSKVSWAEDTGRHTFEVQSESHNIRLWYEAPYRIRRVDLRKSEQLYTLLLGNYESINGLSRPTRMKFMEAGSDLEIELSVSDLRKIDAISPSTFVLEPPAGVEVRTL